MPWDAIVAGAGPAGSVAAYVLAREGRRVLLADPLDIAGCKVGEALPGAALRLLRALGLPMPEHGGPHAPIGGNLSSWGSDELVATDFFRHPDGQGWRLDRVRFDSALRAAAVRSGAVLKPLRLSAAARDGAGWDVRFADGGAERAGWLVDATGRRAVLARRLGARRLRDAPLIALYALGRPYMALRLNRTIVEAASRGWWYAAVLPSGKPLAGFHVRPKEAVRLAADPPRWRQALAETRHVGAWLSAARFDCRLRPLDASGGRLDRFAGARWIACGDAALSFDPISGQGILSALYGGMIAAQTVAAARDAAFADYASRLEDIRRIYYARWLGIYRAEIRWPDSGFWSAFRPMVHPSRHLPASDFQA
jgi:flavin-dependent dehydrogenase